MGNTYYRLNVKYPVGVRFHSRDRIGKLLQRDDNFVVVPDEGLRDFKIANKRAILEGLIVVGDEPNVDWETPNSLTAEDIKALVGNYLKLKQTLPELYSLPIVENILEVAKENNRPQKTLTLIQSRIEELSEETEDFTSVREALEKQ